MSFLGPDSAQPKSIKNDTTPWPTRLLNQKMGNSDAALSRESLSNLTANLSNIAGKSSLNNPIKIPQGLNLAKDEHLEKKILKNALNQNNANDSQDCPTNDKVFSKLLPKFSDPDLKITNISYSNSTEKVENSEIAPSRQNVTLANTSSISESQNLTKINSSVISRNFTDPIELDNWQQNLTGPGVHMSQVCIQMLTRIILTVF